nr:protein henna-like [Penaeus vannamei]
MDGPFAKKQCVNDVEMKSSKLHEKPTLMEGGQYILEGDEEAKSTTIIFSMTEEVGALANALKIFQAHNVNLLHIESRPSRREAKYEFMVECDSSTGNLGSAMEQVRKQCSYFQVISRDHHNNKDTVPWFPRKISDFTLLSPYPLHPPSDCATHIDDCHVYFTLHEHDTTLSHPLTILLTIALMPRYTYCSLHYRFTILHKQ